MFVKLIVNVFYGFHIVFSKYTHVCILVLNPEIY